MKVISRDSGAGGDGRERRVKSLTDKQESSYQMSCRETWGQREARGPGHKLGKFGWRGTFTGRGQDLSIAARWGRFWVRAARESFALAPPRARPAPRRSGPAPSLARPASSRRLAPAPPPPPRRSETRRPTCSLLPRRAAAAKGGPARPRPGLPPTAGRCQDPAPPPDAPGGGAGDVPLRPRFPAFPGSSARVGRPQGTPPHLLAPTSLALAPHPDSSLWRAPVFIKLAGPQVPC